MVPLFVIFLIKKEFNYAFIVFIVAGVTDGLDGFLARYLNQRSRVGSILDPIADKLLLSASYVSLALLDKIPDWLCVIVISRDVIIVGGIGVLYLLKKEIEFKPTLISKWTTVFQITSIVAVFLANIFIYVFEFINYIFISAAFLTIASGLHYSYVGLRMMNNGK
jgi:cardiolipin synthase